MSSVNMSGGGGGGRAAALFTASQWQELEHQALIFKYLMAGIPPPPDLLLPLKKSLDSMSARIFQHHPNVAWGSFYGKKVDPEPGRCRRTDGKKWRCSKDAYPDSKYCERHMHRGRNRSRKPVEAQSASQSSSIGTRVSTTGSSSFQNLPMHSISTSQGPGPGGGVTTAQLQVQPGSYWMTNKDNRYISGIKNEGDERGFFTEPSGSSRSLAVDSSLDSSWRFVPSRVNSFPESRARNGSLIQSNYPQLQTPQDLPSVSLVSGFLKQQHCFLGSEMAASDVLKVKREAEGQPLRSFFDEWPKTRESWSDLDDERSNRTSFSTTQLSISIPMSSSDFSATSLRSQNDD